MKPTRKQKPSARTGEGKLLVTLSQRYGWVFLPKPKTMLMFDRKANELTRHYEYRIAVPATSALTVLLPPVFKLAKKGRTR